jgi:hypothetical protein
MMEKDDMENFKRKAIKSQCEGQRSFNGTSGPEVGLLMGLSFFCVAIAVRSNIS